MGDPLIRDIFVFGSNLAGRHGRGAALYAATHYRAKRGVGEGLTGDAYALPTKGFNLEVLPLPRIKTGIEKFSETAWSMPGRRFLLTPVGTGLAGYEKETIWRLFENANLPVNVLLTSSWITDGPSLVRGHRRVSIDDLLS